MFINVVMDDSFIRGYWDLLEELDDCVFPQVSVFLRHNVSERTWVDDSIIALLVDQVCDQVDDQENL